MGLKEYWTKRDFETTPEPKGKAPARAKSKVLSFVIQKHAASHLHYDFRLELDGTLKSWAVPKGPSLNPKDKRLAVHVEDHPLEYGGFEGVIPPKQYGSGSVIIWDRGSWEPLGDPQEAYVKGKLKFQLHGEKLHGGWTLARMGGRAAGGPKENWLLIKENDQEAKTGDAADIVATHPLSVESGRDVSELAFGQDKVWNSKPKSNARLKKRPVKSLPAPPVIKPQLATLVDTAPSGGKWVHEIKYDGYRMLCRIDENGARMYSRNEKEWTTVFPTVVTEAGQLPLQNAWLDGEVVSVNAEGVSSFQALQNGLENGRMPENILYYVFDLLYLDGEDLTALPLLERKTRLAKLLANLTADNSHILYSDHMQIEGEIFYRYACQHGLEGIISKDAQAQYSGSRSRTWLKTKCLRRQEFVIAGYTEPAGSRSAFGALLLGIYDNGKLSYSGKVGTGFNEESLHAIHKRLSKIEQKNSPLVNPPKGYGFHNVHWVKPELVAEIGFSEWTDAGSLRHPTFHGLRDDKPAKDVVKEVPSTPPSEEGGGLKKTANKKDAIVAGVKLTHPERVLFKEANISKYELAEFYERIGEWILPHLSHRPLTLVRCPDGGQGKCFYQKHANATVPKAIGRIEIQEAEGTVIYMNANDVPAIVGLVQMGVLEFHTWGSHSDKPECPDRVTFDLDPDPSLPWSRLTEAAMLMRARLQSLGLESFVKTTGSKGLHVVMPLVRKHTWDEVKLFAKALSEEFAKADPKRFTSKMTKATRVGKIYIDYLRNGREATAVAAFSTRAKPHAPVSTPLAWAELEQTPASDHYTVKTLPARLEGLKQDPWKEYAEIKQSITVAIKKELKI